MTDADQPDDKPAQPAALAQGNALVPSGGSLPGLTLEVQERLRATLRASKSEATWRAYESEWRLFVAWCAAQTPPHVAMPATASVLISFVVLESDRRKISGLRTAMAAIAAVHKLAGQLAAGNDPQVRAVLNGLARSKREIPKRAAGLRLDDLETILAAIPDSTLAGLRDRALLLLGFFGAFRRSELSKLQLGDIEMLPEGIVVRQWSKTVQAGEQEEKEIGRAPAGGLCAVAALDLWLARASIFSGPVFRGLTETGQVLLHGITPELINRIVQRRAKAAGLSGAYSGHSLRAGLVTEMAQCGAGDRQIMAVTGHRDSRMLTTYTRRGRRFENNVVEFLNRKKKE